MENVSARFGSKKIWLYSFSDANFTINLASKQEISLSDQEGAQDIKVMLQKGYKTIPFQDGALLIFTTPQENPGEITFVYSRPVGAEALDLLLDPDSIKQTNGSMTSMVYTYKPGTELTHWSNCLFCRLVDPDDDTDQSLWVEGRVAPMVAKNESYGPNDITRWNVTLRLVGGTKTSTGKPIILRIGDPDSGTP